MTAPPRTSSDRAKVLRHLGPGLLFAGAAIGVSHLVQATQAGARYGLALIGLILLVHVLKYPALSAGPRYAAATGESLIDAYRRQGRHAIGLFGLVAFGTALTIQAAIALVTASIVAALLTPVWNAVFGAAPSGEGGGTLNVPIVALVLQTACAGVVAAGGFRSLDRVMKGLMVVLLVSTLAAAAIELSRLEDWSTLGLWPASLGVGGVVFIVALIGWMPAPLDIAVWNSLWSLEKNAQAGARPSRRVARAEFLLGYTLAAVTACCFVVLGATVMHQNDTQPAAGGAAFASQIIDLYQESLGPWASWVIGPCAAAVMLSTLLTVTDALPRTATAILTTLNKPVDDARCAEVGLSRTRLYWGLMAGLIIGATAILQFFVGSLGTLVDIATTLSFLPTPLLAWFNHRAVFGAHIPPEHRPGRVEWVLSWIAIAGFGIFAVGWVAVRFFGG